MYGIQALVFGPLALLHGQFGWFANLPLVAAWIAIAIRRRMAAGICGAFAFLVSLHTLQMFDEVFRGDVHARGNELSRLGVGFYLWTLSMLVVVLAAVMCGGSDLDRHKVDE